MLDLVFRHYIRRAERRVESERRLARLLVKALHDGDFGIVYEFGLAMARTLTDPVSTVECLREAVRSIIPYTSESDAGPYAADVAEADRYGPGPTIEWNAARAGAKRVAAAVAEWYREQHSLPTDAPLPERLQDLLEEAAPD